MWYKLISLFDLLLLYEAFRDFCQPVDIIRFDEFILFYFVLFFFDTWL